jgi:hypothetical protein
MNIPPMRNLPPFSEPWGRWAQEDALDLRRLADSLGADTQNDGRSSNSTMDNISGQVNELYGQRAVGITVPTLSIVPPQSSWASATVTALAPVPQGGPRRCSVLVSGVPSSDNASMSAVAFYELSIGGTVLSRSDLPFGAASVPPGFLPTLQVAGAFLLKAGDVLSLTIYASRFTATAGTVLLSEIQAVFTPAQLA